MKAIVYTEYGPPDVLQFTEVAKPVPKDDEVLIRIHAASVNPLDWHFMRGLPYMMRAQAGLRKPKATRLGVDVAGHVEAAGKNVTQFAPGDEVFGACKGTFAEYVCAPERSLVLKPANVTFEQAAAVAIAAFTALQGLRDKGHIQAGQKALINGAAGGVGTFAVQIAKWLGADVTGVCSTRNVDMVRSIGADQVIDYTQEDFTKSGQRYHLVLDMIGNHPLSDCRRALNPDGTLLLVGGSNKGRWLGPFAGMLKAVVLSRFVSQKALLVMAHSSKEDLLTMQELSKSGKVTPVIDRTYPLSKVPEAIRYLEEGHARGKVVITMEQ
ncbi:MAG: NAD(P)-dependent alcohol dehydrogenase [Bryobacteraceae bacterium]|jgi:NADPH:quinone reductase-like Zn-dependent oxidoreductase